MIPWAISLLRRSERMLVAMPSYEVRNSLKVRKPRNIMSRRIKRDHRSPSISTEALRGHPERRVGGGFLGGGRAINKYCLPFAKGNAENGFRPAAKLGRRKGGRKRAQPQK